MSKIQFKTPKTPTIDVKRQSKTTQLTLTPSGVHEKPASTHIPISKNVYVDFAEPKKTKRSDWCECDHACDDEPGCCRNGCDLKSANIECHIRAHGEIDCGNQRFQRHQFPKTYVAQAVPKEKGRGLFAGEKIKKNSLIIEYIGEVINKDTCLERLQSKQFYALQVHGKYIDASVKGNNARFANHSCRPNAESQGVWVGDVKRVGLFAIEDIEKDEEITFNYYFENWSDEPMICLCGAGAPWCTGYMEKGTEK